MMKSKTTKKNSVIFAFVMIFALTLSLVTPVTSKASYPNVTNLKVTNVTANSISIQWTGEDASNYKVYYQESYSNNSDCKLAGSTSSTSYTITGLKQSTVYYIKVEGYDDSGYSNSSSLYNAKTMATSVTGLKQDTWYHFIENASVEWNISYAIDSYEYKFKNGKGKVVEKGTTKSTNLSFNVKNYNVYTFSVRGIQNKVNGKKHYTKWNTIKVFEQSWVKSAKLINSKGVKKLSVKWTKQSGACGYDVYVATKNSAKSYKKVKSAGKNTTSMTLTKFNKKKLSKNTYYVYVISKAKSGNKICNSGKVYTFKVTSKGFTHGYIN